MALEDKDFILRQIHQLAEGLGMMLSKNTLKELINYDQAESVKLSDDDIEGIILVVDAKQKAQALGLTEAGTAQQLGFSLAQWQALSQAGQLPTLQERQSLQQFVG